MKLALGDAVLWTLGMTAATLFGAMLLAGALPNATHDLVMRAGVQVMVYLAACALFASKRAGSNWSALFAVRRTSLTLALLALPLGVALYFPAETLAGLIERLAPLPKAVLAERAAELTPRSLVHGVALALLAAVAGPFVEELFFRGALFTGLRPAHTARSAVFTTGMLFTLTHPEPRLWPPILALSVVLGALRAFSGSLWPAFLLHASFNGTALGIAFASRGGPPKEFGHGVVIGGALGSIALVLLAVWIGRASAAAARARSLDLDVGAAVGETAL